MFVLTSLVPKNIIPSEAAKEYTSSKGILVCPLFTYAPDTNLKEYILLSVHPASTTAPPSITLVIVCSLSILTIVSPSAKSLPLHDLPNGATDHIFVDVASLPVINNLFFTNHIPFKPPLDVCAVVSSDQVESPSNLISSEFVNPLAVVKNKPLPNAAIPVKL